MKKIIKNLKTSVTALLMLALMFVVIEPAIGSAASVQSQMTETLTVTSEISFITPATSVVLSPSIAGITGGTAVGTSTVAVLTNNATGYNMTIMASSSLGMIGNNGALGGVIPAYVPSTPGVPDYNFNAPANTARFGYTVDAASSTDVAPAFRWTGSACNTGASTGGGHCWLNASTSAVTIINRSTPTSITGATSSIGFRVTIMPSPSPAIPQDTYVATTTLTATTN